MALQWLETTPRHPTVTSGPILGQTFVFWKSGQNLGNVQEPENQFSFYGYLSDMPVLRVVIRNAGFTGSCQNQNKHALRERRPPAFCVCRKCHMKIKYVSDGLNMTYSNKTMLKNNDTNDNFFAWWNTCVCIGFCIRWFWFQLYREYIYIYM